MNEITVITPTIGRRSLKRLIESLSKQNIKLVHFILWDRKRCEDGYEPDDKRLKKYENKNYQIYHISLLHPIQNKPRIDNYLRSVGIMMATTPYITQIDDDCWIEESWLKRGIENMKEKDEDYCFCKRKLWISEEEYLGIDDYESIGVKNDFGYYLMETNSILFTQKIAFDIACITNHYGYGHDRIIAQYLIERRKGIYDNEVGLNQIVPDFLVEFHKKNVGKKEKKNILEENN
jgi:hypothetical protein